MPGTGGVSNIVISIADLLVSLSLSLLYSLLIAVVYRFTHRGMTYERSFLVTLVLLSPIVALVMMFIGSNLALSLGMVGALSIIRFRTVIKDSRDMVYLFWVIAVGLGCGTYNWTAVLASTLLLAVAVGLLHLLNYGKARHAEYILVVSGAQELSVDSVKSVIQRHATRAEIRSIDAQEGVCETVFELRFAREDAAVHEALTREMRAIEHVRKVSLLAPQLALPL